MDGMDKRVGWINGTDIWMWWTDGTDRWLEWTDGTDRWMGWVNLQEEKNNFHLEEVKRMNERTKLETPFLSFDWSFFANAFLIWVELSWFDVQFLRFSEFSFKYLYTLLTYFLTLPYHLSITPLTLLCASFYLISICNFFGFFLLAYKDKF